MDKQEKYSEDPLRRLIDPERIEKAPEGFTLQVMQVIADEKNQLRVSEKNRKKTLIPYISSALIIVLTIAALLLPESDNKILSINAFGILNNLKTALPNIDLKAILGINVPSVISFGLIGILLLSFLDRALYRVFHREK
jgi:hypothetical protein